jgi:hypothetical protein
VEFTLILDENLDESDSGLQRRFMIKWERPNVLFAIAAITDARNSLQNSSHDGSAEEAERREKVLIHAAESHSIKRAHA